MSAMKATIIVEEINTAAMPQIAPLVAQFRVTLKSLKACKLPSLRVNTGPPAETN
jgi:hypothetical protein